MNRKRKSHDEWLDSQNYKQLEWTGKYLGLWNGHMIGGVDYNQILGALKSLVTTPEATERMRKLWRLEKHRKCSGLKNHNFALTQQAASKLRKIAKRRPLRHVLEEMIDDEDIRVKHFNEKSKKIDDDARRKVYAAEHSLTKEVRLSAMKTEMGLEMERTQKELNTLSIKVFFLLGEVSKWKVVMKNNGLTIFDLTDEQKSEAESLSNKMKEEFFGNRLAEITDIINKANS